MAYSVDLRKRIVDAVRQRKLTLQQAADTFEVGVSTVQRYLRRYHQEGDLTPRTSPGRPRALPDEQEQAFRQQILEQHDLTLEQHAALWEETTGVRVSAATMCRCIAKLGMTRKKEPIG